MAKISLRKKHTKPESEVKTMVEELARSLAQRYDAKTRWDGDGTGLVNITVLAVLLEKREAFGEVTGVLDCWLTNRIAHPGNILQSVPNPYTGATV